MFLRLTFLSCLASLLIAVPTMGMQPPREWLDADYPAQTPAVWYGVEIGVFPSRVLAGGIQQSLNNFGWGPVILQDAPDGSCAVIVGETARTGDAWYLREEIAIQKVASGRVVEIPMDPSGRAPRGFATGALLPVFEVAFAQPINEAEARRTIGALSVPTEEDADPSGEPVGEPLDEEAEAAQQSRLELMQNFIQLWENGRLTEAAVGRGAIIAANHLYETRAEPELALFLASRVASGAWGSTPDATEQARTLVANLLHGHRRDWRAAWGATRVLEAERTRPVELRVADRLRQAALMVELFQLGNHPSPTLPRIRQHLRRTHEMIPPDNTDLSAATTLFYLQTFAWEGNWGRVETLSRAWLRAHGEGEPTGRAMLARLMLARSLERTASWSEGINLLTEIIDTPVAPERQLRQGMELRDLAVEARELLRRFRQESLTANPAGAVQTPEG